MTSSQTRRRFLKNAAAAAGRYAEGLTRVVADLRACL
jgi:hypothetical protein